MANKVLKERYVIEKQLSKNAGRRTVLAQDLQTQELVAIKLLIFNEDFEWDNLKLFEREAQTLQLLSHPAIPRYLDYFDVDTSIGKGFALVQSYIPAKSLEEWLKSGRTFSEEEVKQLAKALLEILRYLHGQQPQVIHRDIKPSNILLENRSGNSVGEVYLVDFGSVNTLAAKKGNTITVVGTYGYMPPEQFGGRNVPASDLYSLGATLIYLVTGRHPADLPQDNLSIQFESAVNLNPDLIDWLKWMTQPSLNRRLASAEEALKALENPRQKTGISAVRQKPFGSRIQVNKNGDNVEIFILPKMLSFWNVFCGLILMFSMFSFALLPVASIIRAIHGNLELIFLFVILLLFLSLPCGMIGFWILWELLATSFRSTRLNLNQKQISLTYMWPWWKRQETPLLKKDISQLIYKEGLWIQIIAGQQKYTLYSLISYYFHITITHPEIEWLAHELSEWSGVPITVEDEN
ncbi:serine/threonine protein kinase [Limnofasciculus baicalensis]|uniref:Serine/threonine protein kinase n=1 Tax=Limnofasciculus baicalensis BBK-W-15 TaxID=2699891 RepID=A0AAE3GPV7_9CYAN|nr:serine/threonine-protein kinase [Limnofasciculus baicalensis]MCP2727872.1 serine/threonine protein kinase [Limnofasciculus baicalensis BBK-W-15]